MLKIYNTFGGLFWSPTDSRRAARGARICETGLLDHCGTVKPVCNDHLYNKSYYLSFIQQCGLMITEGTNLLVLTISRAT